MIVFKKIRYKNFLSTGNTPIEIDFDKTTTTLVVGTNGSGKSTLLDALCFVLFNKPFRLIKKDQLVNTINQGDCVLEVEFVVGTIPYMVRRGIKPNIFEIYKNRKLINQDANNVDYQKYLEQTIMKLNYRAFVQVVLLGSSSYEPFMKLRPRYRREVVEEILDIRVFGHMDQILRSQQAELQKNLTEMRHHSDLLRTKYESEAKYLASISSKETDFKEGKLKSIEKNNENIAAGFLWLTNSKQAFFGYMVSNYKYRQEDRQYAMDVLITTVEQIAKKLGYNYIFTITRNMYMQNKHKKLGWLPAKALSMELIKKL